MLAPLGFNSRGWAPAASALIYKSFVRPVIEYGLALFQGSNAVISMYEKVQTLALRTLTSTPRNTSGKALMKLLQVEPMSHRRKMLTLRWAARLNSSGDATNFGGKGFSLRHSTRQNPNWCVPTSTGHGKFALEQPAD